MLLARALGSIKSEVAKLAFLRQLGAHEWDLSDLNPNRRQFLAQVGRRSTSQTLQRMPDRRRYPILVVLLHETTLDLVDEIVDLFNRALKKTDSRSRRELEAWRVATAQASNEKVRLFSRLGRLVLDPDIPDEQLRRRIFEEVASRELFAAAVEETEQLIRPRDGSYRDSVENRYGHLRKFAPLGPEGAGLQEPEDRRPPNRCSRDSERAESQATTAGSRGRGTRVRLRRLIAVVLMLVGTALIATIAASVSAYFIGVERTEEYEDIKKRLDRMYRILNPDE